MVKTFINKIRIMFASLLDFQQQMWVVSIAKPKQLSQSIVISEDDFSQPYEWMYRQGYSHDMVDKIKDMKLSSVLSFKIDNSTHQIARVK